MGYRLDRLTITVLAISTVSLAIRLFRLGTRVAHWDEARVAYWILEYGNTGVLFYRPIIHGPLLKLVNAPLVDFFGPSDFIIRLVPALVGGLLPLSALLIRHRFRPEAVVGLAILLAFNPVLVYYSRFMRNDILTGTFMFVAFLLLVRAIDFRNPTYAYLGAILIALGFGAKENALAYLIAWAGAFVLLVDHRLFVARGIPAPWVDHVQAQWVQLQINWKEGSRNTVAYISGLIQRPVRILLGIMGSFFIPFIAIYAPRGTLPSQQRYYTSCAEYSGYFDVTAAPTLGEALTAPWLLPRLVIFTIGSTAELYVCQWISPRTADPNPYVDYLFEQLTVLFDTSAILVFLALVGFIVTRYRGELPSDLVAFCFYWGIASIIGYPYMTDIVDGSWLIVHIVLPFTIPAAVVLGWVFSHLKTAIVRRDSIEVVLTLLLLLLIVGSMGITMYSTSYQHEADPNNPLVQYAQPGGDFSPLLMHKEVDSEQYVLLYGDFLVGETEITLENGPPQVSGELDRRPRCANWFNSLPLPWYFEASEMSVSCANTLADFEDTLESNPHVIIVHQDQYGKIEPYLEGYRTETHNLRSFDTPIVFAVDESR